MTTQTDSPKCWHVDLACSYVTHFRSDVGFDIGFQPGDFAADDVFSERDYVAEPMHFSPWGNVPSETELFRLCREAVAVYVRALRARDARRAPSPTIVNTTDQAA